MCHRHKKLCLSGVEKSVAGVVGHGRGEVAEFDAISGVQEELVDTDVSVDDAAGVQVTYSTEHLREVAARHGLGQQTAGRL